MRLKSIKLAGFKSFVDPTTVQFPRSMSGIVGPNGCGKSNVIDAVRWVMGESSAKHLRGESMADVIFNGSSSRKPIGQASIELIFDNTSGVIKGELAAYNEVSVKRRVTRDGLSQYYLNNNKCRKKDVTDLFLGTGLGPRSYAIIEQGTISRMIESKPEELRVFIEEAAGISKYKERRRETENRMRHTRENLERLTDLREELDRQLQNLQRQARAAERYKQLKAEERQQKALLNSFRWNQLDHEAGQLSGQLREREVALEQYLHQRIKLDHLLDQHREQRQQASDEVNQAQADYYGSGAEIAKIEQQIKSVKEREQELQVELDQLNSTVTSLAAERDAEQVQLTALEEELAELRPELEVCSETAQQSSESLALAEERMQSWQQQWDEHANERNELQKAAEVEQARIQQTEKQIDQLVQRKAALATEKQSNVTLGIGQQAEDSQHELTQEEGELEAKSAELNQLRQHEKTLRSQIDGVQNELNTANTRLQRIIAEQATLQTIQEQDDSGTDQVLDNWLAAQGFTDAPPLVDCFNVNANWEAAIESLLGSQLNAKVVSTTSADWSELTSPLPVGLQLVLGQEAEPPLELAFGSVDKVADAFADRYGHLQIVDDITQAQAHLIQHPGALCLLPDGSLVTKRWLSGPPRTSSGQQGVLARHRRLQEISRLIPEEQQLCEQLERKKQQLKDELTQADNRQEQLRQQLLVLNKRLLQLKAEVSAREAREQQLARRITDIEGEVKQIDLLLEDENLNLRESREVWQQALLELETTLDSKEQLLNERDSARQALDQLRVQARQHREYAHQLQVRCSGLSSQHDSLIKALAKTQAAWQRTYERQQWVKDNLHHTDNPIESLQEQLEEWLGQHLKQEGHLQIVRDRLNELESLAKKNEAGRTDNEQALQSVRNELESQRMRLQEIEVRKNTLLDQLNETDFELQQLLPLLAEVDTGEALQASIESIANKVARLGAINLAAIDEFKTQSERKVYLDEQNDDLVEALDTLETAIRKIDKETRTKFRETFDQVNEGLQALFPKVFGGGSASLELTGDDLLETGVSIMARPPGKKNSTIHLLSGGEKALTAIALIFSIFQLNPAPFCMLDEVDAPLDDANVSRYTRLVKEMAEKVQFIYITHNKIAMEMADHLMGVTMHEPGVSRLVSVDVEEAAAMAAM